MTMDGQPIKGQGASLEHLLAHLESSKRALEHQVQQLLEENKLSRSAKKDEQWQMEREKLLFDLEAASVAVVEKEARIFQLEKEVRHGRSTMEHIQSQCREANREKERGATERARMQVALEDAQMSIQSLQTECKSKQEVVEKQRRALDGMIQKLESQKEIFQDHLEEAARMSLEFEEKEKSYEDALQVATQKLSERERQCLSLREAHEKLLVVYKGRQAQERQEVDEVTKALEASQARCEEQEVLIREMEQEITTARSDVKDVEVKMSAAEAVARDKSSKLEQVQQELLRSSSQLNALSKKNAQAQELKAQVDALNRALQGIENSLSEESALRFKAECALNEYKQREKGFLKVEQDCKALQEEAKWRKEQFQSLEEAHSRMRNQLQEDRAKWDSEKQAILGDFELLQEDVQAKETLIEDLGSRFKIIQQSLAHEENCRKLVEFQLEDAKSRLESVSRDYEVAQSSLESFRENSKKEVALLRDSLSAKDRQIKLQAEQTQIRLEQQELKKVEVELQKYKGYHNLLQRVILTYFEHNFSAEEVALERVRDLEGDLQEQAEELMRHFLDAKAIMASKDVEVMELEMELEQARTLSELLRASMEELGQKHLQKKNDMSSDLQQALSTAKNHEEVIFAMRSKCEGLQQLLSSCKATQVELEIDCEKLKTELNEERGLWHAEICKARLKIGQLEKQANAREMQVKELHGELEEQQGVISTLKARCDHQLAELQSVSAKQAHPELDVESLKAKTGDESIQATEKLVLSEAVGKLTSPNEIKGYLGKMSVLSGAGSRSEALQLSPLEEKLQKQQQLQGRIKERMRSLMGEFNETMGEVERVTRGVGCLHLELQNLQEESKSTKEELTTQLQILDTMISISCDEQKDVTQLMRKVSAEINDAPKESNRKELEGAHCIKSKEVQEQEQDNKSQSGLLVAHDHEEYDLSSATEDERRILVQNLSKKESLLEESQKHIAHLQNSLQHAQVDLEAETQKVCYHVAARNAIQSELDSWKEKGAAMAELMATMKEEFSFEKESLRKESQKHIVQLQNSLQRAQADLEAETQRGRYHVAARNTIQGELDAWKEKGGAMTKVAANMKEEFASEKVILLEESQKHICRLQDDLQRAQADLKAETQRVHHHVSAMKDIHSELDAWKEKGATMAKVMANMKEEFDCEKEESLKHISQLQESLRTAQADLEAETQRVRYHLAARNDIQSELDAWKEKGAALVEIMDNMKEEFMFAKESLLEESQKHISQLQSSLQSAQADLEAQTQRVWNHVAARNDIQSELDAWKEKGASMAEIMANMKEEFAFSLSKLHADLKEWEEKEDCERALGFELELCMQAIHQLVGDWERKKVSLADEGQTFKLEMSSLLNDVREEFLVVKTELVAHRGRESQVAFQECKSDERAAPNLGKHVSPGLEGLVQALQEEAVEIKQELAMWKEKATSAIEETGSVKEELAMWKEKATSAIEETGSVKEELERTIAKFKAEVEGWKDRSAMSVGQRIVARRQLEDFAKQVKLLQKEAQDWKELATETEEVSLKSRASLQAVEEENRDLKMEMWEWKQKACCSAKELESLQLQFETSVKDLEMQQKRLEEKSVSTSEEARIQIERLHCHVAELEDSVERWKKVAASAEEEGNTVKLELLDTLDKLEDELEVWSAESNPELGTNLKEDELDCLSQSSEFGLMDWRQGASEVNMPLHYERGEGEKRACSAKNQEKQRRQQLQITVKELQLEVEAWKKSAACIAEDGRLVKLELEKKVKELQAEAKDNHELRRKTTQLVELQAELKDWKVIAADAAEECTSLRVAYENVMKEVQVELAEWKEKAEIAYDEATLVKVELEKVVEDVQREAVMWREKAERTQGVPEKQDDHVSCGAVEAELNLWKRRAQEGESLQQKLQEKQLQLENQLTETHIELQKWIQRAAAVTTAVESLQEELVNVIDEGTSEIQQNNDSFGVLQLQLNEWKLKAQEGDLVQMHLKGLLLVTQSELQGWKQKAAAVTMATESLKEELDCVIEEGKLEKEELCNSISALEAGLCEWQSRAQGAESLQIQLENLQSELKEWKEKAIVGGLTSKSLMEELDITFEEGLQEKQEHRDSIIALRASVQTWKDKTKESKSLQTQLKNTLVETQTELQDWKERAAAVALATKSLEGGVDYRPEDNKLENENLCNLIHKLEAEVCDWKARAQEGVSVQLQLERTILDLEEKAAAAASDSQALKEELDCTIGESSYEIQQLCNSITVLEAELSEWKIKAQNPLEQQLEDLLTKSQSELLEWKEKTIAASAVIDDLKNKLNRTLEESRSEKLELFESVRALRDELSEWKMKAEQVESLCLEMTSSQTSTSIKMHQNVDNLNSTTLDNIVDVSTEEGQLEKQEPSNVIIALEAQLCEWKRKAEEGELILRHQKSSFTEAQLELQELRGRAAEYDTSTQSLKAEIDSAANTINVMSVQLLSQKENQISLQKLSEQLKSKLELLQEETLARKEKMSQILSQLETTRASQKELQEKLHLATHRLLAGEELSSNRYMVKELDPPSVPNSMALCDTADGTREVRSSIANLDESFSFGSQSEHVADNLNPELYEVPAQNVAVDQLKQELSSLKFLVSKLEHVRGGDGGGLQASVAGDGQITEVTEQVVSQEHLAQYTELCRSLLKKNQVLQNEVNRLQIQNTGLEMQAENLQVTLASHIQKKDNEAAMKPRLMNDKFRVLADVDGNSPFMTTADTVQFEAVCLPNTPEQVPVSRLRRTITDSL